MSGITVTAIWPLVFLAALPLVWLLARHSRASIAQSRVTVAAGLRSVALIAIIAALTRPVLHRGSEEVSVVYALDVSSSISRRFLNEALTWIAQIDAHYHPAQSRFVVFSDHAELVDSLEAVRALALEQGGQGAEHGNAIDPTATNLGAGLLATLSGLAPGLAKRVVLVSDGNQTEGDVWPAMLQLQAEGARVFAVPASVAVENDAWVERIVVPPGMRERASFELEARVFSRRSAVARVEAIEGGRTLGARSLSLTPGENRVFLTARMPRKGVQALTVRVRASGDELPRNDALTEDVIIESRPHVLYVEGGERPARYLADALTEQGLQVSLASAQRLSEDARLLTDKDVVILSDVRANSLGHDAVERLRVFVRDRGGGLIFVAGQNTYGQEGFAKSELERLLPMTFESKRKHEDLDLVLLVDRSSSMRGQKIEISKSAARASLDLLDPEHRLAVVAFDAKPHDVVPLVPVGSKREAENLIARMTSNGQTDIYNALTRAQELLAESKAKTKHIILLSDGLTSPPPGAPAEPYYTTEIEQRLRAVQEAEARVVRGGAAEPPRTPQAPISGGFEGIMEQLSAAKVTLSTVAIGEKPDVELMGRLAKWGNGKSYVTRVDAEVPTLFAAETRRLLNDSIVEENFRPRVKAWSPTIAGVDFARAPELKGYVATKRKVFSDVLLEAKNDQPLLAETHYGLGKTVGFLSDVKDRWAVEWLRWPGYAKFWAQVVRDSARRDSGEGLHWEVVREGREARIELTALGVGGKFHSELWPRVRVTDPGGRNTDVALRQIGPGRYSARTPLTATGSEPWRFELLPGHGVGMPEAVRAGIRRLFYAYPDEDRLLPANLPLLRTLSEQTGGQFAPRAEEIFESRGDGGIVNIGLWPYLTSAALLLFLLDVLARRAPWAWRRR